MVSVLSWAKAVPLMASMAPAARMDMDFFIVVISSEG
jgi:hypothetical protein